MIGVVFVLFYTSSLRADEVKDERTIQDFYHKTVNGLKHKEPPNQAVLDQNKPKAVGHVPVDKDADGDVDADDEKLAKDMAGRLKAAEEKAKELANKKSPLKPDAPSEVVGKGNSAAGQDKKKEKAGAGKEVVKDSADDTKKTESDEEHAVEVELNTILKKSPGRIRPYPPFLPGPAEYRLLTLRSYYLLQVLLPILEEGQGPAARKVLDRACTIRRRT